jgi:hypothetical protein
MSSSPDLTPVQRKGGVAPPRREIMCWNWPIEARCVLAAAVVAGALGLAVADRSVPRSPEEIVSAPHLSLDVNTAPPRVLETLPHVGQALVRQLVAAREVRPLASLDDAGDRVRGLGPVTRAQIAPYLRFEPSAQPGLGDPESRLVDPSGVGSPPAGRTATARSRKRKSVPYQPKLVSRSPEPGTS